MNFLHIYWLHYVDQAIFDLLLSPTSIQCVIKAHLYY